MGTNTAEHAVWLHEIADALASEELSLHIYLSIRDADYADQPARVATIDTAAKLLGLTAEPVKDGSVWRHQAREERGEMVLTVCTYIKAPAQRCACGAVCGHTTSDGAP